MQLSSLHDLLVRQLQALYSAEEQILKALPPKAKAANSPEVSNAFELDLKQTEGQVKRLEQVFEELGEKVKAEKCKAIEGLIAEGKELLKAKADPDTLDAALIGAAQKVEHYEIAAYGTARTWARQLAALPGSCSRRSTRKPRPTRS
ncbi:MAG: ferritin-like domain-containing protein [Actinomycetota bacterium]